MTLRSHYKGKYAVLLLAVAMCLLLLAGVASAAVDNIMQITINGEEFGYTGCTGEYIFDVSEIATLQADCLNKAEGADIYISFKLDGVQVTSFEIEEGYTVPVKIFVANTAGVGQWYFAQPTVEVDEATQTAKLHIENLQIANTSGLFVDKIVIGDDNQNLKVTNPCAADEYCAEVFVDSNCSDIVFSDNFNIISAPDEFDPYTVECRKQVDRPCDDAFSVSGVLLDCGGKGVGGIDGNGWPLKVEIVGTGIEQTGKTDSIGRFDIDFVAPLAPGTYKVRTTALNRPCGGKLSVEKEITVEHNVATQIVVETVDFDDTNNQLRYNKCNEVIVKLLDDCGYPAVLIPDGGTGTADVFLTATQPAAVAGGAPIVAGHFYLDCPDEDGTIGDRNVGQINSIAFTAGQTKATAYIIPLEKGDITISSTSRVGDKNISGSGVFASIVPGNIELEIVPLVTDDSMNPRAGWPLAAAVRLDYTASDYYDVTFTLNGQPIIFDDNLESISGGNYEIASPQEYRAAFDVTDAPDEGIYPYCHDKWYFMLYPDKDLRGDAVITVNIAGVGSASATVANFVSPVEMERTLLPDAWQTFSTPKLLADPGEQTPEYGSIRDLLDPLYDQLRDNPEPEIFILKYKNGFWQFVRGNDQVDPLAGYFVRTPQRASQGRDPYVLQYVFARATQPGYAMPYSSTMWNIGPGPDEDITTPTWNSIGVGVAPVDDNTLTEQSDTAAHAFGSLLRGTGSYSLWNPGVKMANVNTDFTTLSLTDRALQGYLYDPYTPMYNGDVYWVYGSALTPAYPYTANVGLDTIEWVGGSYIGIDD